MLCETLSQEQRHSLNTGHNCTKQQSQLRESSSNNNAILSSTRPSCREQNDGAGLSRKIVHLDLLHNHSPPIVLHIVRGGQSWDDVTEMMEDEENVDAAQQRAKQTKSLEQITHKSTAIVSKERHAATMKTNANTTKSDQQPSSSGRSRQLNIASNIVLETSTQVNFEANGWLLVATDYGCKSTTTVLLQQQQVEEDSPLKQKFSMFRGFESEGENAHLIVQDSDDLLETLAGSWRQRQGIKKRVDQPVDVT